MKSITIAWATATLLLATAPAAARDAAVRTQHRLDARPKSFVVVQASGQDAAQYQQCAALLRQELATRGWRETAFKSADVAVFVQYAPPGRAAGKGDAASATESTLHIEMFAAKPYMKSMRLVPVYDARVRAPAVGATPPALPELMKAAFEEFPGPSGQRAAHLAAQ